MDIVALCKPRKKQHKNQCALDHHRIAPFYFLLEKIAPSGSAPTSIENSYSDKDSEEGSAPPICVTKGLRQFKISAVQFVFAMAWLAGRRPALHSVRPPEYAVQLRQPPCASHLAPLRKQLADIFPVDHVVERRYIIGATILILQIIGVFPDVDTEERYATDAEWRVLVCR